MDLINKIKEIVYPLTEKAGAFVVDITYRREGGSMVLRVLLDTPGHITIAECGKINTELGMLLDEANVIDEPYLLEVSSPGLDRPIKERVDFERVLGKNIRVTTYAPIDGENVFTGKLLGMGDRAIVLTGEDGISQEIEFSKIANAKLEMAFNPLRGGSSSPAAECGSPLGARLSAKPREAEGKAGGAPRDKRIT